MASVFAPPTVPPRASFFLAIPLRRACLQVVRVLCTGTGLTWAHWPGLGGVDYPSPEPRGQGPGGFPLHIRGPPSRLTHYRGVSTLPLGEGLRYITHQLHS